jgi:hypothetical protein
MAEPLPAAYLAVSTQVKQRAEFAVVTLTASIQQLFRNLIRQ